MKILSFDTTQENISVSISSNNQIIDQVLYHKKIAHAESIIIAIETILIRSKLDYGDIDYFVVTTGPSSFIRIRVGLTVAYSLRFTTKKPVIGINVFDAYNSLISCDKLKMIILHAYHDNFYIDIPNIIRKSVTSQEIFEYIEQYNIEHVFGDNNSYERLENKISLVSFDNISTIASKLAYQNIMDCVEEPPLQPYYLITPVFRKINKK